MMKEFFKDISRVYTEAPAMEVPRLRPHLWLKIGFVIIAILAMLSQVIKWLVGFYYMMNFVHLEIKHWLGNDWMSVVANVFELLFFLGVSFLETTGCFIYFLIKSCHF